MDQLADYLINDKQLEGKDEFNERIVKRCDEICRLLFESVKNRLDRKYGCFELFGLDIMLDEDLKPYLIEINTNPAIFTDTQV